MSPNNHFVELPCVIPTDEEIERERQRRKEADRRRGAAPPLNPLPSTIPALLAECEKHRGRIVKAMRDGLRFLPYTDANFVAIIKGKAHGFPLPSFGRLFDAAVALDLGDAPALSGEPRTGRDAVAVLDVVIAWCRAKQELSPPAGSELAAEQPAVRSKHRGGKKRLEDSDPLRANFYALICRRHEHGRRSSDVAERLKSDKDVVDLAKRVGLPINSKTIRNAVAWDRQRTIRNQQRSPDKGRGGA